MKIAVLLFGHMRTFEQCSKSLHQNLLEKYECDIFIHTWNVIDTNRFSQSNSEIDLSKVKQIYSPKDILVEQQKFDEDIGEYSKDENSSLKSYSVPLKGLKNMLYSMYQVNQLRVNYQIKNNIQYDYILILRPDVYLNEDFKLEKYMKDFEFNSNTVISFCNLPSFTVTDEKMQTIYKASDLFLLFSNSSANILFNKFNFFEKYYIEHPSKFNKFSFHPELSFHEFIVGSSLIHRFYLFPFEVVRSNPKNNIKVISANKDIYNNVRIKDTKKYKKYFFVSLFIILILILYISIKF